MSNPYGGYPPPSEPDPEESSYAQYQPYGAPPNPYGGTPAGSSARTTTDPVSIVGFVLSLLCCTSLVGLVLGIIGLNRTKGDKRAGRWAALSAVIIGAVGTLVAAGLAVFFVWFGTNTVLVSSAEEGQCVDVDRISSADATLWEKDCDEPHDAEIVHVSSFDSEQVDSYSSAGTGPQEFCFELVDDRFLEQLVSGDYVIGLVVDGDEDEPSVGDDFLCYIERRGNDKLDAPL